MCIATRYVRELDEWYKRMDEDFESLRQAVSETDKELTKKYHEIESAVFNVVDGYKLAKSLQYILQKRRELKGEYLKLLSVRNSIQGRIGKDLTEVEEVLNKAVEKHNSVLREISEMNLGAEVIQ